MQAFLTFLFLINGYWIALLLNLPLLGWNAKKSVQPANLVLHETRCNPCWASLM